MTFFGSIYIKLKEYCENFFILINKKCNIIENNCIVYGDITKIIHILINDFREKKLTIMVITEDEDRANINHQGVKILYRSMKSALTEYGSSMLGTNLILLKGVDFMNFYQNAINEMNQREIGYIIASVSPLFADDFEERNFTEPFLEARELVRELYLVEEDNILTLGELETEVNRMSAFITRIRERLVLIGVYLLLIILALLFIMAY
ncbi:hypothetical protein H8356DRAFT_1697058 [Neocallimastix lanati (nom. inval.)]|uniref:Uncharacterized protein n=1 Tax=Neocallimastix californiae TaxID=1754190 RepID=A0A1Y2BZK5_9FUNG|nr:hypothetical protein H8356DRAFT_1697058 [Neocallimastix sp. JGI-2020a]ORY40057.1 hypothetical protein LY90DRAFT_510515 [Neocallimastix californiae]|eukprot:ORY40057.1 hypothetical protein LY90DRAFT_510515 [Neocallimastix californiae]